MAARRDVSRELIVAGERFPRVSTPVAMRGAVDHGDLSRRRARAANGYGNRPRGACRRTQAAGRPTRRRAGSPRNCGSGRWEARRTSDACSRGRQGRQGSFGLRPPDVPGKSRTGAQRRVVPLGRTMLAVDRRRTCAWSALPNQTSDSRRRRADTGVERSRNSVPPHPRLSAPSTVSSKETGRYGENLPYRPQSFAGCFQGEGG